MVKKNKDNEYCFLNNGKENVVRFIEDGTITLHTKEVGSNLELLFYEFDSIKDFRVFCNAITDIIEIKDISYEVKNGKV